MTTSEQLAKRLREVIVDGDWVAQTNVKVLLADLDWQLATQKVEGLNTIAALARHMHYFVAGIKDAFESGELAIRDRYSFDFAPLTSQSEWQAFQKTFWHDAEKLAALIAALPANQLDADFIDKKYGSYARNIDGLIEHCYYHLGQIVLIKKMLSA